MSALDLSRFQFAMTIAFHFIFPAISMGLAWFVFYMEFRSWKGKDPNWEALGKYFGKILALTFAVGVATGIVMEFQFGTNWAGYSKFVGDIFGAPLAAEGVFAFFLESTFMGLFLFGRNKIPKGLHVFSIFMVAFGATLSGFWILVANSWQQTPAGFKYSPELGRAELTDFGAAVFNESMINRFTHTMNSTFAMAAFFIAAISAWLLLKRPQYRTQAKMSLKLSVIGGLIFSIIAVFPTGHSSAVQVAKTQPVKLAAAEGVFESEKNAPILAFGIPTQDSIIMPIKIPGLLSLMIAGDTEYEVLGLNDDRLYQEWVDSLSKWQKVQMEIAERDTNFLVNDTVEWTMARAKEELRPPVVITFIAFHTMLGAGTAMIGLMLLAVFMLRKGKIYDTNWLLKAILFAVPLPLIAIQAGWVVAEVGRQPWIVYGLLQTKHAYSASVTAGEVLFSNIMFALIYILLGSLYAYILVKEVKHGPELEETK